MSIKSAVFSAPTNVMALGHPFVAPAYNNVPGIPIGIDVLTRSVVYFDPWMLKDAGLINSAYGILLGPKGHGKSATLKIFAIRLMMLSAGFQTMRTAINDYKPEGQESEYGEFSRVCQSKVFSIANMSINPFEARLYHNSDKTTYELGILGTAEVLCEFSKGSELTGHENTALRIALGIMLRQDEQLWSPFMLYKVVRSITNEQIDNYFHELDKQLYAQVLSRIETVRSTEQKKEIENQLGAASFAADNYSTDEIRHAGDRVSTLLGNILNGSYAGMFGNKDSLYDTLTQRAVTKDWRGVQPKAETLMRLIDTRIKISAIENNRLDLLPHIELDDEKHKSMDNLTYAKSHSYMSEIARGVHTCNLSATHRLASIRKGAVGSELYRLGDTVISNLGFALIGRQDNDPDVLNELKDRYALSDANTKLLTAMPPFHFGLKLGVSEPLRIIKVFATPLEMRMLGTNGATDRMITRPDVYSAHDLERFARESNITFVGDEAAYRDTKGAVQ